MTGPSHGTDTIVAVATPPGVGGVGVVRVSGPNTATIAQKILGRLPKPRYATFAKFYGEDQTILDEGLALWFPAPHSFTGEDVLELQGHGGPIVLASLVARAIECGSRHAKPGEFSERAFLNDKLDLIQAEAISHLIHATSEQAAKSALKSLQGEFSFAVHGLVNQLVALRTFVEGALDFPEEEIDFLSEGQVEHRVQDLLTQLQNIFDRAQSGVVLTEGLTIALAGEPNVGKSSLLNALAESETAIVTDIPGTTRDILKTQIHVNGMPIHVVDTAGFRDSSDVVEQEGIRRAKDAIEKADAVLWLVDLTRAEVEQVQAKLTDTLNELVPKDRRVLVWNKLDLSPDSTPNLKNFESLVGTQLMISAKTGEGLEDLRGYLASLGGQNVGAQEGTFSARSRHLAALTEANAAIKRGLTALQQTRSGELLAEECRLAQEALSSITGEFTTEDLLGEIFSSFCIGK